MDKVREIMQKFGGAMLVPVLIFVFFGSMVGITIVIAQIVPEGSIFYKINMIVQEGAWTPFRQMPLLFVIGIPISLAKKAPARASFEAFVVYIIFNYFLAAILTTFDFGIDMAQEAGGDSGLAMIASIKTLDTSIIGAIAISSLVVFLHDRFFEKKLPDYLGVFQGSTLVVIIGFFIVLPVAFLTAIVWPFIQGAIQSLQEFMSSTGALGVWIYTFLERILIPTGLHHFIYQPFVFGPAVVENGIAAYWPENLNDFMQSGSSLKEMFPQGGFALHGMSKLFAPVGVTFAFYTTAKPENRKKVLAIAIPAALTAIITGITEPFEFTFLFVAPLLFVVHAFLAATLSTCIYLIGVTGNMGGGLIEIATQNWLPLFPYHYMSYIYQFIIGFIFTGIYFIVFRFLILKFKLLTPGREVAGDVKLYTKKDYHNRSKEQATDDAIDGEFNVPTGNENSYERRAIDFLNLLGGKANIKDVSNCATRLRLKVEDETIIASVPEFIDAGAHGLVVSNKSIQVIVGLDVPQVREEFEKLL